MRQADSIYGRSGSRQLAISQFVSKTYGYMFLGLATTGLVSYGIASSESMVQWMLEHTFVFYGALIAEFLLVMGLSAALHRLSSSAAFMGFLAYSVLNGITFSMIFLIYTMTSIGQVFMISAGMFGGLALYGTVTKKDLTGMGTFFGMGIWGLVLVGLVNIFVRSESLSLGLSAAGVLIFAGLTAYDAQKIRALAYQYSDGSYGTEEEGKGAILGALTLYLNFINLFLNLLRLFGNRRD